LKSVFFEIDDPPSCASRFEEPDGSSSVSSLMRFNIPHNGGTGRSCDGTESANLENADHFLKRKNDVIALSGLHWQIIFEKNKP
jgi:hypothetical protein